MKAPTCKTLRCHATARSLPTWDSTIEAVTHLGFVQADPIRAPARAQDLILRQRVKDYRAGDLERQYPQLPLCEDMLHVYGFLPQQHVPLLHPRQLSTHWSEFLAGRAALRKSVLRLVQQLGTARPREVEKALGGATCESGWGQRTSETRMMLEALHLTGLLRVARRESGQRVYACVSTGRAAASTGGVGAGGRTVPAARLAVCPDAGAESAASAGGGAGAGGGDSQSCAGATP
jgi:uncharacterized protein YcaQ